MKESTNYIDSVKARAYINFINGNGYEFEAEAKKHKISVDILFKKIYNELYKYGYIKESVDEEFSELRDKVLGALEFIGGDLEKIYMYKELEVYFDNLAIKKDIKQGWDVVASAIIQSGFKPKDFTISDLFDFYNSLKNANSKPPGTSRV